MTKSNKSSKGARTAGHQTTAKRGRPQTRKLVLTVPSTGPSRHVKKTINKGGPQHRGYGTMAMAVDASRPRHVPSPIPLGPYSIVRGRCTINLTTSPSQHAVMLLGPHTLSSAGLRDQCITPIVAIQGYGTNVPGTTESYFTDGIIGSYSTAVPGNGSNANLHGLTMVLNCLSPTTVAEGQVYIGSLSQRINRSRFSTWNDVATTLINRREIRPHSAYHILGNPLKLSCFPVDITDWSCQIPLTTQSAVFAENITLDSLSQLVAIFPPTASAVNYSLTVYTEWRMNFQDSALASTATTQMASPMDLWSRIASVGSDTSGFMTTLEQGAQAMDSLKGAFTVGSNLVNTLGVAM